VLPLEVPGHYRLRARDGNSTTPAAELDVTWDDDAQLDLQFASGAVRGLVVQEGGGEPIAGIELSISGGGNTSGGWHGSATSGPDGHFEILHVPAGSYLLTADHSDYVSPPPVPVQVPAAGAPPDLRLALQPAGVLRGTVTGAVGDGLVLRCVPLAAQGVELRGWVKADGSFERRQLAPGPWRCELFRRAGKQEGPVLASQQVEVKVGVTVTVQMALPG
jgi:hypothetical protein